MGSSLISVGEDMIAVEWKVTKEGVPIEPAAMRLTETTLAETAEIEQKIERPAGCSLVREESPPRIPVIVSASNEKLGKVLDAHTFYV